MAWGRGALVNGNTSRKSSRSFALRQLLMFDCTATITLILAQVNEQHIHIVVEYRMAVDWCVQCQPSPMTVLPVDINSKWKHRDLDLLQLRRTRFALADDGGARKSSASSARAGKRARGALFASSEPS